MFFKTSSVIEMSVYNVFAYPIILNEGIQGRTRKYYFRYNIITAGYFPQL